MLEQPLVLVTVSALLQPLSQLVARLYVVIVVLEQLFDKEQFLQNKSTLFSFYCLLIGPSHYIFINGFSIFLIKLLFCNNIRVTENLQRQYREFPYTHHLVSLDVNIFCCRDTFVKIRKSTWAVYVLECMLCSN